jgi:hypothetical protein
MGTVLATVLRAKPLSDERVEIDAAGHAAAARLLELSRLPVPSRQAS